MNGEWNHLLGIPDLWDFGIMPRREIAVIWPLCELFVRDVTTSAIVRPVPTIRTEAWRDMFAGSADKHFWHQFM